MFRYCGRHITLYAKKKKLRKSRHLFDQVKAYLMVSNSYWLGEIRETDAIRLEEHVMSRRGDLTSSRAEFGVELIHLYLIFV